MNANIQKIHAREILDSRGNPTVEVDIFSMTVPRHGRRSPPELDRDPRVRRTLRDRDPKRFGGKGVLTAVSNVNTILAPALIGPG